MAEMLIIDAVRREVERIGGGEVKLPPANDPRAVIQEAGGAARAARETLRIRGRLPAKGSPERAEYDRLRNSYSEITRGRRRRQDAAEQLHTWRTSKRGRNYLRERQAAERWSRGREKARHGLAIDHLLAVLKVSETARLRSLKDPMVLAPGRVRRLLDAVERGDSAGVQALFETYLTDLYLHSGRDQDTSAGQYAQVMTIPSGTVEELRMSPRFVL